MPRIKSKLFTLASEPLLSQPLYAADARASLHLQRSEPLSAPGSLASSCALRLEYVSLPILCPCHLALSPDFSPSDLSKCPSSFPSLLLYFNSAEPLLLAVFLFLHLLLYCLCLLISSVQAPWGQGHCLSCTLDTWTVPEPQLVNE